MDANQFIAKLKANNTPNDIKDLTTVLADYKVIIEELPSKNTAFFSLNVLCTLCRNLDVAPKWRDGIDFKQLLILSIDCVRETRVMDKADRVKTLACIYHIHKHIINQKARMPPELVLKLSFMPFELEAKNLLGEYAKTYWNIFVDRLTFIEKRCTKIPIIKLLPKITEDLLKIIEIYDTVQFCSTLIVFVVKKLYFLFKNNPNKLNEVFKQIFVKLSERDTKMFKNLGEKEIMDIYIKFNDCLFLVAENASKAMFKDSALDSIVRACISIVGHRPDLFHCLQTIYSNTFCSLLTTNCHPAFSETILKGLIVSIETTEKLGYKQAMIAIYPYINLFLKLYVEYNVDRCDTRLWVDNFNSQMQESCLKLIEILMRKLKSCVQLLKCENCCAKTGLHDSLRLSFIVKDFITIPLSQNMPLANLPTIQSIIETQYRILDELRILGCANYEKCFRKMQTDNHNTAIVLNKAQYYEISIKLFDIYLNHELKQSTQNLDVKNIIRALQNKSICELDAKLYESSLVDAFLSLAYSKGVLAMTSEKDMNLVIDIKAKLKAKSDDEESKVETLLKVSVIDACAMALEKGLYGALDVHLSGLEFSKLLKHEFLMYCKLWPSAPPISGVWVSLLALTKGKYKFAKQNGDEMRTLYEVIMQTAAAVRNITNAFKPVIQELVGSAEPTPDGVAVRAALLFLDAEIELAAASVKYRWKADLQSMDIEEILSNRTVPQEYVAANSATQAVGLLAELCPDIDSVSDKGMLRHCLRIYDVYVATLLHLSRDVEGLQLAHCCCLVADCVGDNVSYIRNAGIIIYHARPSDCAKGLLARAADKCAVLADDKETMGTVITFICDAAIYYNRCGEAGSAARLVQIAQAKILDATDKHPDINLDIAIGRLLEAQFDVCKDAGVSVLTAVYGIQRYYLSIINTGTKWNARRVHSLTIRYHSDRVLLRAARVVSRLRLWRRARSLAAIQGAALVRARTYADITDTNYFDEAQIYIDNRLKHVLGLQPSNETQTSCSKNEPKPRMPIVVKRDVEIMLENMAVGKSPSMDCTTVPSFRRPEFFDHDKLCQCYACRVPYCYILACQTSGLEASMYFRTNQINIARNYYNGVLKMFHFVEERLKCFPRNFKGVYSDFIVESVISTYWDRYWKVKVDILIELAFFELNNKDYDVADEHIVEIHEILQELKTDDDYLHNEVYNLMVCSARAREAVRKTNETGLEAEFEELKLSPVEYSEPPKTPVTKPLKVRPAAKIVVKDEEVPKRRKVIKLNLDEGSSDEKESKPVKKPEFKVPVPVTTKHHLELATPMHKSKPNILITQPSEETPQIFTPKDTTPEQFFTPMTSVKTYTKKSRKNVVKNLEEEFSTPTSTLITDITKAGALEVPKRSRAKKEPVKTALKRATSPGKLCKVPKETPRARRLRKPVNFSLDEDDKRGQLPPPATPWVRP